MGRRETGSTLRRTAGALVYMAGVLAMGLAVGSVGAVLVAATVDAGAGATLLFVLLALLVATAGAAVGFAVARVGRRLGAEDAREVLALDRRAPVLYLRSFEDDGAAEVAVKHETTPLLRQFGALGAVLNVATSLAAARTDEEWIEGLFSPLGPVIAGGLPGERVAHAGAARLALGTDWQETIRALMRQAQLVVIRIGDSAGLAWEIDAALALVERRRVLFYLTFGEDRDAAWAHVRDRVGPALPAPLPADPGPHAFLGFDADGTPRLLGPRDELDALSAGDLVSLPEGSDARPRARPRRATRAVGLAGYALLPLLISGDALLFAAGVAATALAAALLVYRGRRAGWWHAARFGAGTLALSLWLLLFVAVFALDAGPGDPGFFAALSLGVFAVVYLVFQPVWAGRAVRADGLAKVGAARRQRRAQAV